MLYLICNVILYLCGLLGCGFVCRLINDNELSFLKLFLIIYHAALVYTIHKRTQVHADMDLKHRITEEKLLEEIDKLKGDD